MSSTLIERYILNENDEKLYLYNQTRDRSSYKHRIVQNLPLDPANMAIPVAPKDFEPGSQWPPDRARERFDRLNLFNDLFNGDMRHFVRDETALRMPINYFMRLTALTASILVSSPLEGVPEADIPAVRRMLADALINAMRSGFTYMVRVGNDIGSPETVSCWDGEAGETYILSTATTAEATDSKPNIVYVTTIADGVTVQRVQRLNTSGQLGDIIGSVDPLPGLVGIAHRPPIVGSFGTSKLKELIAPVIAKALRYSGLDAVLAKAENPPLAYPMSKVDAQKMLADDGVPKDAFTKQDRVQGLKSIQDNDAFPVPDGGRNPAYIEMSPDMINAGMAYINQLDGEISLLAGFSKAIMGGSEMPSGTAMKRLLYPWYAESKELQSLVHDVAQVVYGAPFEWMHPFDIEEQQAVERMQQRNNEAQERRGQIQNEGGEDA